MRLLFVSMTTVGGSGRSQRELARTLGVLGHQVQFLVADERTGRVTGLTRWLYDHCSDLSVRVKGQPGSRAVDRLRRTIGRRLSDVEIDGLPHALARVPENALAGLLEQLEPDAVVVSSVDRWAWRLIGQTCASANVPTVLYVREDDSLRHLEAGVLPTALVANAASLADSLRRAGHDCTFVPSVVDTSVTRTISSRAVALAINPIPSRGSDLIWQIASRVPDISIVLQESWPLTPRQLADVEGHLADLPNVTLRPRAEPGPSLYADARVLLVPYRVDNRPRVIPEAQANGIPVIVADLPALVEVAGAGGIVVAQGEADEWVSAIRRIWDDSGLYDRLVTAAYDNAKRPDVDPLEVAKRFERVLDQVVASTRP